MSLYSIPSRAHRFMRPSCRNIITSSPYHHHHRYYSSNPQTPPNNQEPNTVPKAPPIGDVLKKSADSAAFSSSSSSAPFHTREAKRASKFRTRLTRVSLLAALFSTILAYQLYTEYQTLPHDSRLDKLILWLYRGKPYRDYLKLSDLSITENGLYTLLTKDPAFSIKIPTELFIRPGIIFADDIPDPSHGFLEISDVFGDYLSWAWTRLQAGEREMIQQDPARLNAKLHQYAKNMLHEHQKEGYIVMHQEIVRLNPETHRWESSNPLRDGTNPNDYLQDHVVPFFHTYIMVKDSDENGLGYFSNEPNLLPSSEQWQGCSLFVHDGHIFVTNTVYPNNLINFAIMKDHVIQQEMTDPSKGHAQEFENQLKRYLERIESVKSRNKMVTRINESTFDHDRVISNMRDMLFDRMNEFIPEMPPKDRVSPEEMLGNEGNE